jgi:ATP-dependent DNA helicase RecG
LADGLAESQKQILKLIEENPKISKKEMFKQIGISSTAIDKNLKTLKSKQIIRRAGNDKSGHWVVIKYK